MTEKIGVVGLGYVGLPLALALSKKFPTVGFDSNSKKIEDLRNGIDKTGTFTVSELGSYPLAYVDDKSYLASCTFIIVAVPTPVDSQKRPDLDALIDASQQVGSIVADNAVVVFESTVYPGVTEDICAKHIKAMMPISSKFKLGYSPERINPGDSEHTLEKVTKVIAGEDAETVARMHAIYSEICTKVYVASSIKVAEAAKVIENTQRDLNIALMNELALIFDRMNIDTKDVLDTAATKWNFLPFKPGLVGGHCIGVDPYYLTTKAEELGYHPEVILAGRRINDSMGKFVAQKTLKLLAEVSNLGVGADVCIFGLTFKENVRDIRNSRVPDIVEELKQFGVYPVLCDPLVDPREAWDEYGVRLISMDALEKLDAFNAIILAVPHDEFMKDKKKLLSYVENGGVLVDVKAALPDYNQIRPDLIHWCL